MNIQQSLNTMSLIAAMLTVGFTLLGGTYSNASAQEAMVLYDDFDQTLLDPNKWVGAQTSPSVILEANRKISKDALKIINRSYGRTDTDAGHTLNGNNLNFPNPDAITAIQATVTAQKVDVQGCGTEGDTRTFARIGGSWFSTDPDPSFGDVLAFVQIAAGVALPTPPGIFAAAAVLLHTPEPGAGLTILNTTPIGLVSPGQPAQLLIEWDPDNDQFIFQLNDEPAVSIPYELPDQDLPASSFKQVAVTHFVDNCTTEPRPSAFMKATFDDVFVNESAVQTE